MKKIAIYMAIFGGYDFLYEPKYVSDNCDYIVFTDSDLGESDVWDIRQVTPLYKEPVRMARKYKALPSSILLSILTNLSSETRTPKEIVLFFL